MSKQKTAPKYSPEVRERAVRMVREHASQWAAIVSIATRKECHKRNATHSISAQMKHC
jgi:transposase